MTQELARADTRRTADVVRADGASLMEVISRAAADQNTDVEKLERLLGLYERINAQTSRVAYMRALAAMQVKLPTITERGTIEVPAKDGKAGHSTPFARWEDINEAIRPVLAKYGFGLSFRVAMATDGKIEVTGVLSHRDGHQEQTTITLPHDSTGSKNAVQAVGSSTSYGKRYTCAALLNITTRGEDDDGQAGGARGEAPAVEAAFAAINAWNTLADAKAWKAANTEQLQSLPRDQADKIVRFANERTRKIQARDDDAGDS